MPFEKYIVADYVNDFRCKCGDCRNCCCVGWPVTITYREYLNLLGLQCGKALKKRIDCAFYVLRDCSPDRYAEINRNPDGECHLRDADGKCALHKALGEKALPSVCKMYPRNFRSGRIKEATCAMSCEGVLESMFSSVAPLSFHTAEIETDNLPDSFVSLSDDFIEIQKTAIAILQNRNLKLSERIIKLGDFVNKIGDGPVENAVDELAFGHSDTPSADVRSAIDTAFRLAEFLCGYSVSFGKYGTPALENFCYDSKKSSAVFIKEKYEKARDHLYEVLPDFDIYMEDILVNHLFFERFPYSYSGETYLDEYAALVGVYALLRVVLAGYMTDKTSLCDFVDCAAGLFRYIEHGNANKLIKYALSNLSFDSLSDLAALAKL